MDTYKFDIPRHSKSIIKVIGVGGGGSNAVNHMYNLGIKDVEFVVCNTDSQALKISKVPNRLQIGANLTEGLGAGANPEVGRNAAMESKEDVREILGHETKMVFITAGMGGGTGTGAAPVIARIAREMDILTVGIVTVPFGFEGRKKMEHAHKGMEELKQNCDTVLVILNDKLREIYGNLTINNAFAQADNVLTTAAKGIAEIITVAGYVNVDFQDVRTVMKNAGAAVMGSAETSGESRAQRAAEEALASPLLDSRDIMGAQNILLSIISGEKAELQMDELTEITEYIQEKAGDQAEVIFGHGVDAELEDRIRVTVIATGFDRFSEAEKDANPSYNDEEDNDKRIFDLDKDKQFELFDETPEPEQKQEFTLKNNHENYTENKEGVDRHREEADRDSVFDDSDEDHLFTKYEDEFEIVDEEDEDQDIGDDGTMEFISSKERLEKQAQSRMDKLKSMGKEEISTTDFKEKLDVPAYLRRQVKLDNVPHSSMNNISKYKLNEENKLSGGNKFLHDNVD